MGDIRGIFVTAARVFSGLLCTVSTGNFVGYLVGAMPNQSQPHVETASNHLERGQSPSAGNGNPAPATGHGARPAGDSESKSMRGSTMGTMAGRETGKWFLRWAFPVATWFLCLGTGLAVPIWMIGLIAGTYYPTRDSHIK